MSNDRMPKRRVSTIVVGFVLLGIVTFAIAGSLNPTSAPGSTMRTLSEIYDLVAGSSNPNETLPIPEEDKVAGTDFIHMRLTGDIQGDIDGECAAAGREDTIVVEDVEHGVALEYDPASGAPTGKRQHKPLVVTKRIDKSTPLLMNVLVNNENISNLELRFWRKSSRTGPEFQYYTVELINARISDISYGPRDVEKVSFVYQTITWTYEDGGITADDSWVDPIGS